MNNTQINALARTIERQIALEINSRKSAAIEVRRIESQQVVDKWKQFVVEHNLVSVKTTIEWYGGLGVIEVSKETKTNDYGVKWLLEYQLPQMLIPTFDIIRDKIILEEMDATDTADLIQRVTNSFLNV